MPEFIHQPSSVSASMGRRPGAIRHFTELIVWQKARRVGLEVFRLSRTWPRKERYSLTDQVRRSGRSIGANIAEAWGRRRYEGSIVAKLVDADAEANDTEHWLINAEDHGYSTAEQIAPTRAVLVEVGRMLGAMINKPEPVIAKRSTPSPDL